MTRKAKTIVVSVFFILIAGTLTIPAILEFSTRNGLAALRREGINLRIENLKGSLIGVSADRLDLTVPIPTGRRFPKHLPFPLVFSGVEAYLSIKPLQHILPRIFVGADILKGRLNGTILPQLRSSSIDAKLDKAELSSHPALRSLGLKDGRLTITVADLLVGSELPSASNFTIALRSVLFELKNLLPSIIPLDMLEISEATIEGSIVDPGKVNLESIALTTNLASIKGRATGQLSHDLSIENLSATINVQMIGADSSKIQNWIPLLTGATGTSPRRSFSCTLNLDTCNANTRIRLNDSLCLTYRCT